MKNIWKITIELVVIVQEECIDAFLNDIKIKAMKRHLIELENWRFVALENK